jgi:hypothetical protein
LLLVQVVSEEAAPDPDVLIPKVEIRPKEGDEEMGHLGI